MRPSILIIAAILSMAASHGIALAGNLTPVKNKIGRTGFINGQGELVIRHRFVDARNFHEGRAAVYNGYGWGFIDERGKLVTPYTYSSVSDYSEGLAAVNEIGTDTWGYIDNKGKTAVPAEFKYAEPFYNGLAEVVSNNSRKYIDAEGNIYDDPDDFFPEFDVYTDIRWQKDSVEWVRRGRYESSAQYSRRMESETSGHVRELKEAYRSDYLAMAREKITHVQEITFYDPDNEMFAIIDRKFGPLLVQVPKAEARVFEDEFLHNTVKEPVYSIESDTIVLAQMSYRLPDGKIYKYVSGTNPGTRAGGAPPREEPPVIINPPRLAEVDSKIPVTGRNSENTFAVIIANSDYEEAEYVNFAANDGRIFREYCIKTFGIPENNIEYYPNATRNHITKAVEWMKRAGDTHKDARLIFYYAGHGASDPKSEEGYLLPVDGDGRYLSTACKLSWLYNELAAIPSEYTLVLLDACYSGTARNGNSISDNGRASITVKVKDEAPKGNCIVLSAAQSNQTAWAYDEKGHGMFSYFMLECFMVERGIVHLGGLYDYIRENVRTQCFKDKKAEQVPSVSVGGGIREKWRKIRL